LQDVLIANDPDGLVVDFYRVDYRADAALASIGLAVVARPAASICFRSALRKECLFIEISANPPCDAK
jgi:hypothetical protein